MECRFNNYRAYPPRRDANGDQDDQVVWLKLHAALYQMSRFTRDFWCTVYGIYCVYYIQTCLFKGRMSSHKCPAQVFIYCTHYIWYMPIEFWTCSRRTWHLSHRVWNLNFRGGGKMSWLVSTEAHSDLPLPSKTGRKPPFLGKKPPPIAHKSWQLYSK